MSHRDVLLPIVHDLSSRGLTQILVQLPQTLFCSKSVNLPVYLYNYVPLKTKCVFMKYRTGTLYSQK